jgi:hypothetical protein
MASQPPLNCGHPTVVTPLSTLVSVATVGARDRIRRSPSLSDIVEIWPASISPRASMVAIYLLTRPLRWPSAQIPL